METGVNDPDIGGRGVSHKCCPLRRLVILLLLVLLVIGIGLTVVTVSRSWTASGSATTPKPSTKLTMTEAVVLYSDHCAACHGNDGDGRGMASSMLDPRPRDFRKGFYRIVSSSNGVPTPADVQRTIRAGIPGTAMPSFAHLRDDQLEALAAYVLSFTKHAVRERLVARKTKPEKLEALVVARTTPEQPVRVPAEPVSSAAAMARAKRIFAETCATCHGADGSGRQDPAWRTEEGFPIASRNFTAGAFKGGASGADLYTRIYTGMPGTPMPSFSALPEEDVWALVHYVQSLGKSAAASPSSATAISE